MERILPTSYSLPVLLFIREGVEPVAPVLCHDTYNHKTGNADFVGMDTKSYESRATHLTLTISPGDALPRT